MTPGLGRPGGDPWQNAPEGFLPPSAFGPDHYGTATPRSGFDRDFKTPRTIFEPISEQSSIYDPNSSPRAADMGFSTPGPMPESLPDWVPTSPDHDAHAPPFIPTEMSPPNQHARNPSAGSGRMPRPQHTGHDREDSWQSPAYMPHQAFPTPKNASSILGRTPKVSVQDIPDEGDPPRFPSPEPVRPPSPVKAEKGKKKGGKKTSKRA